MKNVKTITGILIGNFILALGVTMFVVPFGLNFWRGNWSIFNYATLF